MWDMLDNIGEEFRVVYTGRITMTTIAYLGSRLVIRLSITVCVILTARRSALDHWDMFLAPVSSLVSTISILLRDQWKIGTDFLSSRTDRKLRSLRKSPHRLVSYFARLQRPAFFLPSSCHLQPQTRCRRLLLRSMARPAHMHFVYPYWSARR